MAAIPFITEEDVADRLTWRAIVDALRQGHLRSRAAVSDNLIEQDAGALLTRSAWIDGLGVGVKAVTVMADNPRKGRPSTQGAMVLFDHETGAPSAAIDGGLVTKWKTAADSVLGARILARPESERLLVVGAGEVARSLLGAYAATFPGLRRVEIWNRTRRKAEALASAVRMDGIELALPESLAEAVRTADIVAVATMSREPVVFGEWVQRGAHIDLIGAYKADMREADDALLQKSELFVDCRETTLDHIGELMIPLANGAIQRADIKGDLYDLCAGAAGRSGPGAITVFKNGGGAHLDVMTARAILDAFEAPPS